MWAMGIVPIVLHFAHLYSQLFCINRVYSHAIRVFMGIVLSLKKYIVDICSRIYESYCWQVWVSIYWDASLTICC